MEAHIALWNMASLVVLPLFACARPLFINRVLNRVEANLVLYRQSAKLAPLLKHFYSKKEILHDLGLSVVREELSKGHLGG